MRQMFPDHANSIVDDEKTRTIFDVLKANHGKGYSSVNIVVGSDRVKEFENLGPTNTMVSYTTLRRLTLYRMTNVMPMPRVSKVCLHLRYVKQQ